MDVGGFEFKSGSNREGRSVDLSTLGLSVGEVVERFGGGRGEEGSVREVFERVGLESCSSERVVVCCSSRSDIRGREMLVWGSKEERHRRVKGRSTHP